MNFNQVNFLKNEKYNSEEIMDILKSVEGNIACKNGRQPVPILYDENTKMPFYDVDKNEIVIPYNVNGRQLVKLMASTSHESNHANQELSPFRTQDEKTMIAISNALYPSVNSQSFEDLAYVHNYKEMDARLEETKFLINLYRAAKSQVGIMNLSLAQDFINTISDTYNHLDVINNKGLRYIANYNKNSIKKDEYDKSCVSDCSKKDLMKFLKKTAPKMYKNKLKEIKDIQKELLSIKKEIEFLYGKDNIGKVTNELSALKTAEREQHRNDIMQMYEDQTISHINISPHENHDVHEVDCFDDFKEFIDKILDDNKTTEIYTQINIDDDKYIVFLPQKEPSFADNVLEGPETHNITTSLENINIEK